MLDAIMFRSLFYPILMNELKKSAHVDFKRAAAPEAPS